MKIQNLQGTQYTGKPERPKNQSGASVDFQQLLETQLASAAPSSTTQAANTVDAPQVAPLLRVESLSLAEETIGNLDSFGQALENLSLTEESLLPFVESLEEETASLLSLKEQLPPDDPLAKLIDRVASVSYVQTAKFRRGDYQ